MPFDGTDLPDSYDLQSLARMRRLFRGGEGWCQHRSRDGDRYCLIGAADACCASVTLLLEMVGETHARGFKLIPDFNDKAKSYAEIEDFLDAVERRIRRLHNAV